VSSAVPPSSPIDRVDTGAPWARRLSTAIAVGAGVAATITIAVLLYTVVVGRVPGVPFLLAPGIPMLAVGQVWCIVILFRRAADRRRTSEQTSRWSRGSIRLRDLRGGLSRPLAALFVVGYYAAAIVAGLSMWGIVSSIDTGSPTDDPSSCEYSSNNHGEYRCLTKAQHDRQEVSHQRFVGGILGGFFVAHCGIATSEVLLRRQR